MSTITTEQTQFYHKLREIDPSDVTDEVIQQAMAERVEGGSIKDPTLVANSFRLLHRVARAVSEEEWQEYIEDGSIPPMKLSPEEMELARGGFCLTAFGVGVGIGLAIGAIVGGAIAITYRR